MSTTRLSSSYLSSYGDYAKEFEVLKKLLQKTTEEMKACCADQLTQSRCCEESERVCEELLEDVKQDVFEISRELEEGAVKDDHFQAVTELRQIVEENNREFLAAILVAQEGRTKVRKDNFLDPLDSLEGSSTHLRSNDGVKWD